jgi:hypothetical protein
MRDRASPPFTVQRIMKLTPSRLLLPLLAIAAMTSCVVPGDYAGGPGISSVNVGYRQYSSLPVGYIGDAYYTGGRYYSGGRYENGTFYNQGRSYNNRYYHGGQYYYGGSHQHHGSTSPVRRTSYSRNSRSSISPPTPFMFHR